MKTSQTITIWICVAGTLAVVCGGVWFYLQFNRLSPTIKGKVVALEKIEGPGKPADIRSIQEWMNSHSGAFPGCRCAIGESRGLHKKGMLLYCVGFAEGPKTCHVEADKLPEGTEVFEAPFSETKNSTKAAFLLETMTGTTIISPVTSREMIKSGAGK